MKAPRAIWIDRWFASSAGIMLRSLRAAFPDSALIYTHHAPSPAARAIATACHDVAVDTVDAIAGFAERSQAAVILPSRHPDLFVRALPLLQRRGTAVAIPSASPAVIDALRDKSKTYAACDLVIPGYTPRWATASSPMELRDAVTAWTASGQRVCYKPVYGEGAAGFRIVDPAAGETDNFLTWPNAVLSTRRFGELVGQVSRVPTMLVSDYLPGPEYSVDVASVDGSVVVSVTRRKIAAAHQRIESIAELDRVVAALSESWSLTGCWNAQFRHDGDGKPRLLEVNARPAAGSLYLTAVGVNFPELAVRIALGLPVAPLRFTQSVDLWRSDDATVITPPDASQRVPRSPRTSAPKDPV